MITRLTTINDLISTDQCFSNWGDKNPGGLWIYSHDLQVLNYLKCYIKYYIFDKAILKLQTMFTFQIT